MSPRIIVTVIPLLLLLLSGCTQKVKVEAPEEPIQIEVHVKIEHEIRVKVEKELEEIFNEESGLF